MRWLVVFAGLLVAIWAATQSREAPQLILLSLLYLIAVSVTTDVSRGSIGLVPLVSVCSLLLVGLSFSLTLLTANTLLAALIHPLWAKETVSSIDRVARRQRGSTRVLIQGVQNVVVLGITGIVHGYFANRLITSELSLLDLRNLLVISITYGTLHLLVALALWAIRRWSWDEFPALAIAATGFLPHPFAFAGALAFLQNGLPVFVVYCLAIAAASLILWLSTERRLTLEQRMHQLQLINRVGAALREVLDTEVVLERLRHYASLLVVADNYYIGLQGANGEWSGTLLDRNSATATENEDGVPDEFTHWVISNRRTLVLDSQTMRFASRHGLSIPEPRPGAWLGVPLATKQQVIGVMVARRYPPCLPFDRWSQELFHAIAGQATAAIQNAQLYGETVRLYNLTDEALSQRLNQLQALLNAMSEGVLMIGTDGRILLVNRTAAALLRDEPESLTTQPIRVQKHASHLGYGASELESLVAMLRRKEAPRRSGVTFQRNVESAGSPTEMRRYYARDEAAVRSRDGGLIGWLMLFRDITEERELEHLRRDMTRMIVHDLRNPLTTLTSLIDQIQNILSSPIEASEDRDRLPEFLKQARHGGEDLLDMVDSLMDVGRLEEGQPVVEPDALNMVRLTQHVMNRLQPLAAEKGIGLDLSAPADLPPVWADEGMLRRILANLLDNALKFTPRGGSVIARLEFEQPINEHNEAGVRCTIQDDGPGIPEEFKDHVFGRYMRTNPGGAQIRGTGLGLAFCKLAVEAHGGKIWVDDAAGKGSCFIFTVPGIPVME